MQVYLTPMPPHFILAFFRISRTLSILKRLPSSHTIKSGKTKPFSVKVAITFIYLIITPPFDIEGI